MKVNNIHDKLFRHTFSHVREARILLKNFLPRSLVEQLDFSTLKNENTSFVDSELQEYFSDLIYSCAYGEQSQRVLISILLEHKSYVVNPYPQLMRYLVEGYDYQYRQHQKAKKTDEKRVFKYQVILPVVVYHGEQTWKSRPFHDYFHHADDKQLKGYIPSLHYELIDLNQHTKEEIFAIEMGFALTALQLLKHRNQQEFLLQYYQELFIFEEVADENNFKKVIILYLLQGFGVKKTVVDQIINDLPQQVKLDFMTAYESLIQEGMIKGEKIGFIKGEKFGVEKGEKIGKIKSDLQNSLRFIELLPTADEKQVALFANVKVSFIKRLKKAIPTKKDAQIIKTARTLFAELEDYKKKDFTKIDEYSKEVLQQHRKNKSAKN